MNKSLLMNVTGALLFVGASGCATIGTRPPETVSERTVSTVLEHQRRAGDPTAEIQQDGTMVVVRAIATCLQDDVDVNTVERVREAKHYNASPVGDWWAGIGGGIALGTGALMIATPSTFASNGNSSTASGQPSSGSSGTSSVSPGAITGLGVGLVVLGAALLTIPIVDAVRSSGSDKSVTRERVPGPVLRRDLSCPSTPMAGGRVSLATVPPISVGVTNQDGMAQVDLAHTVADPAPRRGTVNVLINGSPVGHVDLTPLVVAREEAAWLVLNPQRCASEATSATCGALFSFSTSFPNGAHSAEANLALAPYRTKLEAERKAQVAAAERAEEAIVQEQRARLKAAQAAEAEAAADQARAQQARQREADEARADAAAAQARQRAMSACRSQCGSACSGDDACQKACVVQKCH
jgi:hypothetical protein